MRDVNHIVEEYRQSDIAKRMHLFIEFRELRGEFSKIDRNEGFVEFENKTDALASLSSGSKMVEKPFSRHLKGWNHRFRKCFQGST
jgi:hypothetical protein